MASQLADPHRHLLALCGIRGVSWPLIARRALEPGGLDRLLAGHIDEDSSEAVASLEPLHDGLRDLDPLLERADHEHAAAVAAGARLITVLDDAYPANLQLIFNLPPFLFVRGQLERADIRAVAVVGTRDASQEGIRRARKMACALVDRQVTVVSGLARGIDTAAHTETLQRGGRTIAVLGTGILRCYPKENEALAEAIASRGALVSQFWPSQTPARYTFPRRNVVTSGLAQGTVVIEASRTSGAKMQARLALEHGKRAFLVDSLVTDQPWAQKYLKRFRNAVRVRSAEDVVAQLESPEAVESVGNARRQLTIDLV